MPTSSGLVSMLTNNVDIIKNIAASMLPIQNLITGGAYLLGLFFAFKALTSLRQLGESRAMMSSQHGMKEPLIFFLVAAMLLYFPTGLSTLLTTTFGTPNIIGYDSDDGNGGFLATIFGPASILGRSLVVIIQTIGLIAFIRGWILISRSSSQGQQPGGTGKGIMHVFGGILAINIVLTLQIINNTVYGI